MSATGGKRWQDPDVARALALTFASSAWDRTVDVTTIGRRSGLPRRIEIWLYRFEQDNYLSGTPGRRAWFENVRADPRVILHLKHGARADLPARGVVITDEEQRRRAFAHFVADLNQPHDPARIGVQTHLDDWMAGSPLVRLDFEHAAA